MSFFSGSSRNLPASDQRPLGLEPRRLSTNEQARPVPLLYGRDRVGVTFISEAFHPRAEEVKQDVPKKSDDITTGWNYYASFAGLICHGPIDAIRGIFFDGQKVWPASGSGIVRDGSNPTSAGLTIEGWGTWTVYWGTESQGVDATLSALASDDPPVKHPAYKGFAYFVAEDQFLGYQSNKVPVIEVEVERYCEKHFGLAGEYAAWLTGRVIGQDINPMVAAVDLLTSSRYGLALRDVGSSDTALNRTAIQAAATVLSAEGLGVSRTLDRQQSLDQVLVTLLETIDGWHAADQDGKIKFGLNRPAASGTALPVLDEKAIVGEPELRNPGWSSVPTEIALKYLNASNNYWDDVARASNALATRRVTEPQIETLDRPWIRNPNTAQKMAHAAAKALGRPKVSGVVIVRRSRLQGIGPGSRFLLHYDQWDLCNLPCVALAVTVQDPFRSAVEVEWEVDRAALGEATYTPAAYVAPARTTHSVPDIEHVHVVEVPYLAIAPNLDFARVTALVRRPASGSRLSIANGWQLSYQKPDTSYRSLVQAGGVWAYHGTLNADYSATATGQIQLLLSAPQALGDLPNPASANAERNEWILCVKKSDGLDEWFSVHTLDVTASPVAKYSVLRERYDTGKRAHVASDEWFLFPPHVLFSKNNVGVPEGGIAEGGVMTCKTQSITLGRVSEAASAPVSTLTIRQRARRPWKPKGVTCSTTYTNSSTPVTLSWTAVSKSADTNKGAQSLGAVWVIEIRAASADPTSTPLFTKWLASSVTTWSILGSELGGIVGLVHARITVAADEGAYRSLYQDEFVVNKV